ncbi:MAG: bifunctional D-glycero-beta-D-manno-heptose-7-phosphate kinase/D-glycero-beta-D-manno-heptose 1-phosphate adenylyltransferase HldE [Gammaproteobacteria bacterium]|nr:bifunctional D-glycero-beta-D-manno-heptose-7-phosphate kinase/D-glycero-beta-D-manno-heptose 1-phosphate adenylyltransferase HldE [Gammaproteobacteria bacterium]
MRNKRVFLLANLNFHAAKVLVLGDVMLDSYYMGSTERISPEAPVPVVRVNSIEQRPGGAANVALNAAALGAQVKLISVLGDDAACKTLEDELHAAGIETAFLKLANIQTIVKQRILCQNQQLLRLDFETPLKLSSQQELFQLFQQHLAWANVVILSDYAKGVLRPDVQLFIIAAKALGIPVLVDPKHHNLDIYRGATLVTPNLKEFKEVVGECYGEEDLVEKGAALVKRYDLEALLITRGGEGMTLLERHCPEYYLPACGREVFDVTGAGDTVISTIAVALASQLPLAKAVQLGNTAAGVVIGKLGTATLSVQELQCAIQGGRERTSGVVDEELLMLSVKEARARGERIVFTNGCFDVLHAMHVEYLQLARKQGDCLIVAVNDDASITRLKGSGRPVNKAEHRMAVLAGLQAVDWVVQMYDDTPNRLLELIRPDVLAKGGDYGLDGVVGADIVQAYGGEVVVLGGVADGVKSTAIIERMKKLHETGGGY